MRIFRRLWQWLMAKLLPPLSLAEQLAAIGQLPELEPFDWKRDYEALYRAAPLAFWLAPGDGGEAPALVAAKTRKRKPRVRAVPVQTATTLSDCYVILGHASGYASVGFGWEAYHRVTDGHVS